MEIDTPNPDIRKYMSLNFQDDWKIISLVQIIFSQGIFNS